MTMLSTFSRTRKKIYTRHELESLTLPHPPYLPDIARSDYHLFRVFQNDLSLQNFKCFEDIEKWIHEWITLLRSKDLYWRGIHLFPARWAKVVASEAQYFE